MKRGYGLACAAVAVAALGWGMSAMGEARMEARLLRADPDTLAGQPDLVRFAVDRGAALFAQHCASCHGAEGHGDASLGVPNLTDRDWLYGIGRISDIAQTIRYGIRSGDARGRDLADMPAFSQPVPYAREQLLPLTPNDIDDVIQYLFQREGRRADSQAAARGGRIFRGRGACWDCHGDDGFGDNAVGAPKLSDRIWLYGDGSHHDIFRSIADGHRGVCPAQAGKMSPAEILETAIFVWSRSGRDEAA